MKNSFNKTKQNGEVRRNKKKNRRLHMKKKNVSVNNHFELPTFEATTQFHNLSTTQDLPTKKIYNPVDLATSSDPTLLLQDYLTISDNKFKEMLLTSMSNNVDNDALIELLNQKDIFLSIRQLAQLTNKLHYSQLQKEQWAYYHNLGITEGIWTGRVSKKMAESNSMCYTYGRSKVLIKQRLQKYQLQCQEVQDAIHEYMKRIPPNIHMTNITIMINNLIHKDQYQLRHELDRRKTMLQLDAEEHKLIELFYNLKPRQTEITSAKIIWKAIHEQQDILHEIAIFQKWLQLHTPGSSRTLQDIQLPNINRIFTSLAFNEKTSTIEHMAKQTLARAEAIATHYKNIAVTEKTKLQTTRTNHKNVQLLDEIFTAILTRENNMQLRGKCELQRKFTIIFNQIPVDPLATN